MNEVTPKHITITERAPVTLVKGGLAIGGASLADTTMLFFLKDQGHQVSVLTGYASSSLQRHLKSEGITPTIDPALDRDSKASPSVISSRVLDHIATEGGIAFFSQALCAAESNLGDAALRVSHQAPTVFRQHNHLGDDLRIPFSKCSTGRIMAITDSLKIEFEMQNDTLPAQAIAPLIDARRFSYSPASRARIREEVRRTLGLSNEVTVIFQPTRVDPSKGIDYALETAVKLRLALGRDTALLVAGGNEPFPESQRYKQKLLESARMVGFKALYFLNGAYSHTIPRRISDIMIASDLVIFPSTRESFGLGIAEAALCEVPILSKQYLGEYDEPTFQEVYGDFDIISDPLDAPTPSATALNGLANVLTDPERLARMTIVNRALARRYTYTNTTYSSVEGIFANS